MAGVATCVLILLLWFLARILWFLARINATDSVWYVVAANFGIMAWATVIFDIYKPSLSSRWFDSFEFEREGRLYEMLGVLPFRSFLQNIQWNKLFQILQ